ncbi:MAG: RNA polymerase subunit sigma-70, partial [Oscillospiraceae bacterium]|nr:RNA polymerase subunit sigma-70 [Oscillospiraceae bacterium]
RYWSNLSIKEIADKCGVSQSKVKMTLLRTRNHLKDHLEKEGLL